MLYRHLYKKDKRKRGGFIIKMQRKDKVSSTPIRPAPKRESLGLIEKNTVSEKVKQFTKRTIEFEPKVASSPPFHSNLSTINETSSSHISVDSGYDSNSFRRRSKSFGIRSIGNSVIDSYPKNFKWSYLKYFGVDPKEYLSQYNIDLDTIDENAFVSRKLTADLGSDDNNEIFRGMRDPSQTFSAKCPGEKLENPGLTKKRTVESDRSDETLINSKTGMFFVFGSSFQNFVKLFFPFMSIFRFYDFESIGNSSN